MLSKNAGEPQSANLPVRALSIVVHAITLSSVLSLFKPFVDFAFPEYSFHIHDYLVFLHLANGFVEFVLVSIDFGSPKDD